ncbi:MAG: branched-chain amino acid ABC transporter permease [Actinomycetota bacterium]|jgi:branched-chain amino acid transport system permease protein|nr:branched-chain amino acid ABC transporter permease [Actinomycetota bacterium]
MHVFIQACILGLLTGGVYALMASGLAIGFGVMRVINVAQGALIILGAYLSYTLYGHFGVDPFVGLLLVTPAMFVLGILLQLAFLRPLRDEEREELSLLVTWAVALGIEGLLSVAYQTTYRSTITSYADRSWHVFGYYISVARGYAFVASLVVLGLLFGILRLTKLGRAIRATVQNPTAARLLGIDTRMVSAVGFGLSVATASAAGAVYGIVFPFNPGSHYDLISRLLSIIVLGGLGSLGGAVIAALFMGLCESVFAAQISPTWSSFTFFVVLIAMLVVRPQGLFGARVRGSI